MANNEFVSDPNELGINLDAVEQANYEEYQDAQTRKPTPPAGVYDVQLPTEFKYKKGSAGQLIILLDPLKIVGGEHDGREIRFCQVSTKKFKNVNASQAADVLRNVGSVAQPHSVSEWQSAFESIAGETVTNVRCVWRGYDKVTQTEYDEKAFPVGADGVRQDFFDIPAVNPETGEETTRRVWANLSIAVRGFAKKA
jgi:hypothetical protein